MIPYTVENWYWVVAGSVTHVYSSAAEDYVLVSDSTYLAWVAVGGEPTPISTEALLYEVLNPETPSAIERDFATGSIDPTDGGPWTFTATSGKFFPIGGTLFIRPFSDLSIAVIGEVKAFDGTDLTVSLRATNATVPTSYDSWSIALLDAPPAKLPYTSISGFGVTLNSGDSRYFDVAAGAVRSWDDTTDLILSSGLTKRANETFVAGTDGGAQVRVLLAGTVSSTGSAVTGSGTAFLTDFAASSLNGLPALPRQISTSDGVGGNIQSVTNNTSLTTSTFGDLGASSDTYYRGGWPGSSNQGHFGIVVARKDSDGSVDVILSAVTPSGDPDLPSGYTKYRSIGYLVIRSNAIIQIVQTLKEVQYSELSAIEAYAIVGNNSSAARYPDEIVISSLTEKTTLAADDLFLVADSAASNALKKAKRGSLGFREVLTANRTYYVRTDGSDSNDGLTNNSGGAFLTFAKAAAVAYALDWGIYQVTVQFGSGSFTINGALFGPFLSSKVLALLGDTGTPSNVTLTATGNGCQLKSGAGISISGFTISPSGFCAFNVLPGGYLSVGTAIVFANSPTFAHVYCVGGFAEMFSAFTVSASCNAVIRADAGGFIDGRAGAITITLTGTPAWTTGFAKTDTTGTILFSGKTFSGSATGPRYNATGNSVIFTNSGGASYFPGNSAGSTGTGGQYL